MNIFLKPIILSTALGTLGLCCTISHATDTFKINAIAKNISHNSTNIVLPRLAGEGINSNTYRQITTFAQLANKPLLIMPLGNNILLKEEIVNKGNAIFLAATIFNDKLHNFMSKFQSNIPSGFMSSKDVAENNNALAACDKENS